MADITTEIAAIEEAIYGRDVRGSIVSALTKMNEECQGYQQAQANAEAAIAAATSAATAANAAAQRAEAAAGNITELVPVLQRSPEEMEYTPINLDDNFVDVHLNTAIPQHSTGLVFEFNTGSDLKLRSAEMPMPGNTQAQYQHAFVTGKLGFQAPTQYMGGYKPIFGLIFCYAKNSSNLCVMARVVALRKNPDQGLDWETCQIKNYSPSQLKAVYAVVPAE